MSSNLPELRHMIMANIGIGALPMHVAARDVEAGRLRQLPPLTDVPAVDICLLRNPKTANSDAGIVSFSLLDKLLQKVRLSQRTYR